MLNYRKILRAPLLAAAAFALTLSTAANAAIINSETIDGQTNPSIVTDSGIKITTYKADGINHLPYTSIPTELGETYSWFNSTSEYMEVFEILLSGNWYMNGSFYTMNVTAFDKAFMDGFFQSNGDGFYEIITKIEDYGDGTVSYRNNWAEFYDSGTKLRWSAREYLTIPQDNSRLLLSRKMNFLVYQEPVEASAPATGIMLISALGFFAWRRKEAL